MSLPSQTAHLLQQVMQRVGFSSFKALGRSAGVSDRQVKRLRQGTVADMQLATVLKLSRALQMPLAEFLETFSDPQLSDLSLGQSPLSHSTELATATEPERSKSPLSPVDLELLQQQLAALRSEYDRLQTQLEQQRETVIQEFQQTSLQVLEPWLIQWSAAAYAAQQNPQAPAVRLLPLLRPVEQLLQQWGVEAIATVGAEVPYDPHLHQLMDGTAQPGDQVRVRYAGYSHAGNLLYRAKVSPLPVDR